eukprot:8782665-Pyramimonas_sp.AAC.1
MGGRGARVRRRRGGEGKGKHRQDRTGKIVQEGGEGGLGPPGSQPPAAPMEGFRPGQSSPK